MDVTDTEYAEGRIYEFDKEDKIASGLLETIPYKGPNQNPETHTNPCPNPEANSTFGDANQNKKTPNFGPSDQYASTLGHTSTHYGSDQHPSAD